MCAGFVPQDFIKGCGVICDPSYLLHFTSTHEDEFDAPALPVTLMLSDFDINADREKYLALLAEYLEVAPTLCEADRDAFETELAHLKLMECPPEDGATREQDADNTPDSTATARPPRKVHFSEH